MTYAGAYGREERLPVDRLLRRENHPLGVRRSEATKIATEEAAEAASSNKRWTFGAAAGALLVAGTFAAGALGISGGATPVAGSAPEHAPASPGHSPGSSPVVGAPVPGKDDTKPKPQDPRVEQTTPASADAPGTPVAPVGGVGVEQSGGGQGGGSGAAAGGSGAETPAPAPAPAPQQPAPQQPAPQQPAPAPAPAPAPSGSKGGLLSPVTDTVGGVLSPVTDVVGGILSPLSGGGSSASTMSAPSGPALTMINPLGDLLGG